MYTSGALSSVPASAIAMVAIAPGMFLAHSVVPSSGSTAMSSFGPVFMPTFSPMNSIGASSRSPSPITTVPSIGSLLSSRRMASTAAWSAAFSLPRPVQRAAATAARSVTRTISSVRTRSSARSGWMVIDGRAPLPSFFMPSPRACLAVVMSPLFPTEYDSTMPILSVFLYPDDLWLTQDHLIPSDCRKRPAHGVLGGCVGDQNDRHWLSRAAGDLAAVRRFAAAALHDRFERDLLLREAPGNRRGGARLVHGEEADVIAAFMTLHRRLLARGQPGRRAPEWSRAHAAGNVADVRHNRGGRRQPTGAGADQRNRRDRVDIDGDRIGHAHHLSDRRFLRHHGRMHPLLDTLLGLERNTEQLHAIAKLVSPLEVFGGDGRNAFDVDRALIDLGPEGEARQDRELLRGVVALDVESGIGFGVAELLCLFQAGGEAKPLLFHARQDVDARAVEDSIDARERIAGQPLAQRFDDRDGAADRSLEVECHAVLLGDGGQRDAMPGEQRFVGGHDRFLGCERRRDRRFRRIALSAHQLHEHVDLAIGRQRQGIADPAQLLAPDIARLAARARADRHDLDGAAATGGERIALALDQSGDARPDRAQTGNAKFQWSRHRRPVWKRSLLAPLGQGDDVVQLFGTGFKKAADIARGLADALLVLDQRNPYVSFAKFAEPAAGRHRDLGLFDQERSELDAAEG